MEEFSRHIEEENVELQGKKILFFFFYSIVFLPELTLLLTDFYSLPSGNSQYYNKMEREINNPKK